MPKGAFIDTSKIEKFLNKMDFSSNSQKNIIRRVARRGGKVLKPAVKSAIPNSDKYEHVNFIRKNVKTQTSKSRFRPGVNVVLKGSDVPVGQGSHRRFWKLTSYAHLVFYGNYNTNKRPHHGGRRAGIGQGNVKGIAPYNPFNRAARLAGNRALKAMSKALVPEIQKEIRKHS
jgi:hypothetical protein